MELQDRLVIEGDEVDVLRLDASAFETECDGLSRVSRVVLLAGEPLFLSSRNDFTIAQQGGGRIMIEGRDA